MPRCPHCLEEVEEFDLLDDDDEDDDDEDESPARKTNPLDSTLVRKLRRYEDGNFLLTKEEAVRAALGHRLELELEPIPRIRVSGRTISAIPNEAPLDELWNDAFLYIVELGPNPLGVCLQ